MDDEADKGKSDENPKPEFSEESADDPSCEYQQHCFEEYLAERVKIKENAGASEVFFRINAAPGYEKQKREKNPKIDVIDIDARVFFRGLCHIVTIVTAILKTIFSV